jgi:probable F420-dependent oxidoreductase
MSDVQVGVVFSQADSGVDADALRDWVRRAEDAGFDHLLAYDHVLGASAERLGPGPFGAFASPAYTNEHTFHEILTLFSHFAAITHRIEFVTSVLVLPQRQTAVVAKQIATLDLLSGGRICPAVGVGWNFAEYEGLGVDFGDRTRLLEEQIDLLRLLWTEPLVDFDGEFHRLSGVGINPLPSRPIPLYIGSGAAEPVLQRVARKADGWLPLLIPGLDAVRLDEGVRRLREMCDEIGRDPATMPIHARVYLGARWQAEVEQALDLGVAKLSLGFDRMTNPGFTHAEHLDAMVTAKPELDAIVG